LLSRASRNIENTYRADLLLHAIMNYLLVTLLAITFRGDLFWRQRGRWIGGRDMIRPALANTMFMHDSHAEYHNLLSIEIGGVDDSRNRS
jgi:hypothetical protein